MSVQRPYSISISLFGPDLLGESVVPNSARSPTSPGRRIEVSHGEAEHALDRLSHMLDNRLAYNRDDNVPDDLAALLHTCFALEANQWASTAERADDFNGALTGPLKASPFIDAKRVTDVVTRSQAAACQSSAWFGCMLMAMQSLIPLVEDAKSRRHTFGHAFHVLRLQLPQDHLPSQGPACRRSSEAHTGENIQAQPHGQRKMWPVSSPEFLLAKGLIVRGLTDVWSEIRRQCARDLQVLVGGGLLSAACVECMYDELLRKVHEGANSNNTTWQDVEGALLGLHSVVNKLQRSEEKDGTVSFRFSEHGERYTSLPPFLVASLPALHNVLGHPQLYVRQRAVQVLTAVLRHSGSEERVLCVLDRVLSMLHTPPPLPPPAPTSTCTCPPSSSQGPPPAPPVKPASPCSPTALARTARVESLSATGLVGTDDISGRRECPEIEGLLTLACGLVKLLSKESLLSRWESISDASLTCLGHPASTVRQSASTFLQHCARRSAGSMTHALATLTAHMQALVAYTECPCGDEWQRMEGLLLCYECLLHDLLLARLQALRSQGSPSPLLEVLQQAEAEGSNNDQARGGPCPPSSPPSSPGPSCGLPLLQVLRAMVSQLEACLQHPRFEVRRMATQTSVSLARLLCWLSPDLLLLPFQRARRVPTSPRASPTQSGARLTFACELLRAGLRHARHVAEIYTEASAERGTSTSTSTGVGVASESCALVCTAARWGARMDGVGAAGSEFVEQCAEVLSQAAREGAPQGTHMVLRVQECASRLLPSLLSTCRDLRRRRQCCPALAELLLCLRAFVGTQAPRSPLGVDDVREALFLLCVLQRLAVSSRQPNDAETADHLACLDQILTQLDPSTAQGDECDAHAPPSSPTATPAPSSPLSFSILGRASSESPSSSPRALGEGGEGRRALLADKALALSSLYLLPSLAATLPLPYPLLFLAPHCHWLRRRDDNRYLSLRGNDVTSRLVSAVALCLYPLYHHSTAPHGRPRSPYPTEALQDLLLPDATALRLAADPTDLCGEPQSSGLALTACRLCHGALSGLLSNLRTPLDAYCWRKLLACLYMLACMDQGTDASAEQEEGGRLVGPVVSDALAYLSRLHGDELGDKDQATEEEGEGEEGWEDWDEEEGGKAEGTSGTLFVDHMVEFLGALVSAGGDAGEERLRHYVRQLIGAEDVILLDELLSKPVSVF